MRITMKLDRFTELRSAMRKAFAAGDADAIEESGNAFFEYMLDRWRNGTFSSDEELWLDQHPKFQDYLEGRDECGHEMPDWYDDMRLLMLHGH